MTGSRPCPDRYRLVLAAIAVLTCGPALGAGIDVRVRSEGAAVRNAVVYAVPAPSSMGSGQTGSDRAESVRMLPRPNHPTAIMDQKNKEFVPHVLPVLRGTTIAFPNSDDTRHQVYSFSGAKTFQLRLYAGTTAEPVVFDKAGVVTLGCNIHDWMLGYIFVVDTPAFAKTGDRGTARLTDLPPGRYRIRLWHPRLAGGVAPAPRRVRLEAGETIELAYALDLKPPAPRLRGFARDPVEPKLHSLFH